MAKTPGKTETTVPPFSATGTGDTTPTTTPPGSAPTESGELTIDGQSVPVTATGTPATGSEGDTSGSVGTAPATDKTVPTGLPMLPEDLQDWDITESISKSGATPRGWGKGAKEPALSRVSDLVKIIATVANNGDESKLNQDALNQVYQQAGEGRVATGISGLLDKASAVLVGGTGGQTQRANAGRIEGGFGAAAGAYDEKQQEIRDKVLTQAWKDLVTHLRGVTGVPGNLVKPPPPDQMVQKLRVLGSLPVQQSLSWELQRKGFSNAAKPGYDLSDLVAESDKFERGAPGSAGIPSRPITSKTSGEDYYQQFMDSYGTSNYNNIVQEMSAIGELQAPSNGSNYTSSDIGNAFIGVMQKAKSAGVSPATWLNDQLNSSTLGEGSTLNLTEQQAYVIHTMKQMGLQLTNSQINTIANDVNAKGGTSSAAGEDWVIQQVGTFGTANLNAAINNGKAPTDYSGWAQTAAENIRTQFTDMGIPISDAQLAQMVGQVMNSSDVTSIYAAGDAGTATGSQTARDMAEKLYPSLAPELKENMTIGGPSGIASSYLNQASNLLGTASSDMPTTDPKWMAWATGGTDGGKMTPQQWQSYLMSNPEYGFQSSPTAKQAYGTAASGLLQLFGVMPGNAFGQGSAVGPTGEANQ